MRTHSTRNHSEKTEFESKFKEHNKKHFEETKVIDAQVKNTTKALKSREKVIQDLNRNLQNTRDALKNCKAEKAQLKTKKTKLEADIKNLSRREFKEKDIRSEKKDLNANITKSEAVDQIAFADSPSNIFSPTMVSHFNPNIPESISRPANFVSMVAHCITTSNFNSTSLSSETSENKFERSEAYKKNYETYNSGAWVQLIAR